MNQIENIKKIFSAFLNLWMNGRHTHTHETYFSGSQKISVFFF